MAYPVLLLLMVTVFILIYASLSARIRQIARIRKSSYKETPSPLSEAIKDFVALAGGVYLGLMALSEFLKIALPPRAEFWGLSFDPIAVLSIVLAIIAPLFPTKTRH